MQQRCQLLLGTVLRVKMSSAYVCVSGGGCLRRFHLTLRLRWDVRMRKGPLRVAQMGNKSMR